MYIITVLVVEFQAQGMEKIFLHKIEGFQRIL